LVKIVDFGIAHIVGKHFQQQGEKTDDLQKRGAAIGTPYYMSPEQVRGELDRIDHRADLYACGIILAEMLTGQRVFEGGSNRDTMRLQLEALPPRMAELNPDREYPEILEAIVAKALSKDPAHRFQSAHEFNQTLEQAMRSIGIDPIWEDIYHDSGEATGLFPMPKRRDIQYKMIASVVPPTRPLRSMMIGVSVAVLLLLGGFVGIRFLYPPPPSVKPKPRVAAWMDESKKAPPAPEVREIPLGSAAQEGAGNTSEDGQKKAADQEDEEPEVKRKPRQNRRGGRRVKRKKTRVMRGQRTQEPPATSSDVPTRTTVPAPREATPTPRREAATLVQYRITTTPNGASVFVDGKKVGATPLTIRGEVGKRVQIEIKKEGYVSRAYLWTFRQNSQNSFRLIEELL